MDEEFDSGFEMSESFSDFSDSSSFDVDSIMDDAADMSDFDEFSFDSAMDESALDVNAIMDEGATDEPEFFADVPVEEPMIEEVPEVEPVEEVIEEIPEEEPVEEVIEKIPEEERVYDEFEETVRLDQEDFYDSGTFYTQGVNEYGYTGTCGETSMASTMNRVLGTNEYTENKVLDVAVQEGLCDTDSFDDSGGTTTDQFMELYDRMNEVCGDQLEVERHDFDDVLSMEEVAQRLEEGCTLNVAVDSSTLWEETDPMGSPIPDTRATDHWITVTGVQRGEDGSIQGFDIIDSGGGESYVDADKYEAMCYGTDSLELTDPTCIVVSKKDVEPVPQEVAPVPQEVEPVVDMEEKMPRWDECRVFTKDSQYEDFAACPEDSDAAFELQRVIHQPSKRNGGAV